MTPRKWKMNFSCYIVENFLRKHCLPRKDVYVWTIWPHSDKLFHGSCNNIGHLAWKSRILGRDSSVWEHFLKIHAILQVCIFFLETRSHNMTQCECFTFFWLFLNFLCLIQNPVKTAGVRVLARSGMLQNYHCISD